MASYSKLREYKAIALADLDIMYAKSIVKTAREKWLSYEECP